MAKDPVCGMIVNEETGLSSEVGGRQFYFCSPMCQQTFVQPEKELSKMKKRMYVAASGALVIAIFRDALYLGVAPGVNLYAVRVLNNAGSGWTSDVIAGIDWVASTRTNGDPDDDIDVANMSLGGSGNDNQGCGGTDTYRNAICDAVDEGVTFVVAAGNSDANADNYRPATYGEVITVSALADFDGAPGGNGSPTCRNDVDDTFANFSNWGSDIDIIAPGVCIESTWKGGGYNTISGTSMASPHVAGAAALYLSDPANSGKNPTQVKSALQTAGTLDWNNVDDPDGIKEKLLNVSGL